MEIRLFLLPQPRKQRKLFRVRIHEAGLVLGVVAAVEGLGDLAAVDVVVGQRVDRVVGDLLVPLRELVAVDVLGDAGEFRVDAALFLDAARVLGLIGGRRAVAVWGQKRG